MDVFLQQLKMGFEEVELRNTMDGQLLTRKEAGISLSGFKLLIGKNEIQDILVASKVKQRGKSPVVWNTDSKENSPRETLGFLGGCTAEGMWGYALSSATTVKLKSRLFLFMTKNSCNHRQQTRRMIGKNEKPFSPKLSQTLDKCNAAPVNTAFNGLSLGWNRHLARGLYAALLDSNRIL